MSLGFPTNPNVGDTYKLGTQTYVWNGNAWAIQAQASQNFNAISVGTGTSTISIGSGTVTINGAVVITTSTLQNNAVTALYAGTDTAVSAHVGIITVWNTSTLQSVTNRGSTTTNSITVANTSNAFDTVTGALVVKGGVGIGQDLYLGGDFYVKGHTVLTTSSFVGQVSSGPDILITATDTGVVYFSDISTLDSVTGRGATTTHQVSFSNTTQSTSSTTGAVTIAGGLGVAGRINSESIQIADAIFDSMSVSVNNTATVIVDYYPYSTFRSAKYVIQIDSGSGPSAQFEVIEILLLIDNVGTIYATEYAVLTSSGELGEFSASLDIMSNNVNLYFTPYAATNKIIKILRTGLTS
jgi:hypothetical protein